MVDYHGIEFCGQSNNIGDPKIIGLQWNRFVSKIVRTTSILLLCGLIASCSVTGPNMAQLESEASLVTGSVTKPAKIAGIESTDTEVIKSTVASAKVNSSANVALAWVNPDTGSSGTITTINRFLGSYGQKCRSFKTTVTTFMGVAFYNGEACQISPSEWVLSWFKAIDAKS